MADFAVFQIEIAKGYDMTAFREEHGDCLHQGC